MTGPITLRMSMITKLTKANPNSGSLRTTVPKPILELLDLKEKDSLEWAISQKDGEIVVHVKAIK